MQFIKPDFSRNIINISATLAEFLGCPNDKPVLPELKKELQKGYKNIVFLILDGFGMFPIRQNLAEDRFLRRNIRQVLTSVFPSTTTNATTTFLTNKYPMEHGWFGWSLYFEALGCAVDLFADLNSVSREPIERGYAEKALPIEPYYMRAKSDYETNVVVPPYWRNDTKNRYVWETLEEFYRAIGEVCRKPGKQFLYGYCPEPDSTMHRYGVSSAEARRTIEGLNDHLEALCADLPDTLFLITADHGQVDIGGCIEIYRDGDLVSMLAWPPYLEARATAFKVKPAFREKFAEVFREKYGEDFQLVASAELIAENYFGTADHGHAELLGDYIAVAKSDKIMKLHAAAHDFKGHHASLTEEMEVPLIVVGDKP